MKNKPKNHYETFEAACEYLQLDPIASLPVVNDAMPEWLQRFTIASVKLAIISEAMREGRKPKPGEWMYVPVFFKDAENNNAGFGFTPTLYGGWHSNALVGERLSLFTREDAQFFGEQFLDLHKDSKII